MLRNIKYIHSDYIVLQADKNPAVKGRASLTHNLIQSYGLLTHMERIRPVTCNTGDLKAFHTKDYVKQLDNYVDFSKTEANDDEYEQEQENCILSDCHGLAYDCPPWPGIKSYVCSIAGATMTACDALCKSKNKSDIVINWCGGWHHAQNDIVLGILVLTMKFRRVLYVDMDNHHGKLKLDKL